MFIQTDDGYVNAAHVVRISEYRADKRPPYVLLHVVAGESVASVRSSCPADEIVRAAAPVVPAAPGFSLLVCDFYCDDHDTPVEPTARDMDCAPIVAWRASVEGIEPVTPANLNWANLGSYSYGDGGTVGIQYPDGRIINPFEPSQVFADLPGWFSRCVLFHWPRWAKQQQEAAKPKANGSLAQHEGETA